MNKLIIPIIVVIVLALFLLPSSSKSNSLEVTDYDEDGNVLLHTILDLKEDSNLMQSVVSGNNNKIKKVLPPVPKGASIRKLKIIITNTGNVPAEFSLRKGLFKAEKGYQKK